MTRLRGRLRPLAQACAWNPNYTATCVVDVDGEVDEIHEDDKELVFMLKVRPDYSESSDP
jgi:hypothetical protein